MQDASWFVSTSCSHAPYIAVCFKSLRYVQDVFVLAEHEGIGRLAALSGHAEMSHDSDEWEMVSSDMDEEL